MCHFKKSDIGATCTGHVDIPHGDEEALKKAVATIGPISVAIDAGHESFQHYKTGVYSEPACSSTKLDHGVLAVGYGTYEGEDYWLVKNRWGICCCCCCCCCVFLHALVVFRTALGNFD